MSKINAQFPKLYRRVNPERILVKGNAVDITGFENE